MYQVVAIGALDTPPKIHKVWVSLGRNIIDIVDYYILKYSANMSAVVGAKW